MYGPQGNKLALMNGQTNGPCPNWTFNTSTNRISTSGFTYDAAGNLTADGTHSYQWDGEGRLVTVDNGATIVLVYNALGQQVGVTKGGTDVVWHLKSPADKSQGDYSIAYVGWNPAGVFFLGEKRVGFDVNGGIVFLHQNNLNSVTLPTTFDGSVFDDILYYPWGQYWAGEGFVFAGMDHYWEDVLHNTPNRQYAFYEGRWLSPDPLGGDVTNPQSLNRYAYVLNLPTSLVDPSGLEAVKILAPGGGMACEFFSWECGGGGGAAGVSTDPSNPCSYLMSNDASCQQAPGLWNNGQPIYPGVGDGGGGGGGGFGSPWPINTDYGPIQPLSLDQLLGQILPQVPGQCEFGACGGPGIDPIMSYSRVGPVGTGLIPVLVGAAGAAFAYCAANPVFCSWVAEQVLQPGPFIPFLRTAATKALGAAKTGAKAVGDATLGGAMPNQIEKDLRIIDEMQKNGTWESGGIAPKPKASVPHR